MHNLMEKLFTFFYDEDRLPIPVSKFSLRILTALNKYVHREEMALDENFF